MAQNHPEVAFRSCDSCKEWLYDLKTGKIHTRGGVQLKRGGPPPCYQCPKESPEKAYRHEMNSSNRYFYSLYWEVRAIGGLVLTPEQLKNVRLRKRLATIHQIATSRQEQLMQTIQTMMVMRV